MKKLYVILDNGHGVDTNGKRSPIWPKGGQQLFEWEFNRAIVNAIALELTSYENQGIECTRLVPEKYDVDLAQRVARANNLVSAARRSGYETLIISVHGNAGGGKGWEVWTTKGQTQSDVFAEMLAESARASLPKAFPVREDKADGDADKESNFYILRHTIGAAVLSENLFMDTEKDCAYMMSNEGRRVIAKLHVDAILKYVKQLS